MMHFQHKEKLNDYLISGYLHLSKKDYAFFNNLKYQIVKNNFITSNQNTLFNKLLLKYRRQLQKLGHDIEVLTILNWNCEVKLSKQEFLDAKVSILDNRIYFKAPFNSKFIKDFKKSDLNTFKWCTASKYYESPFSTVAYKLITTMANKHYENVKFCTESEKLNKIIDEYASVKYWNPTLIKRNNNFYIVGINEVLYNATSHIPLSDLPNTLFELSQYGINIEDGILAHSNLNKFAGTFNVTFDLINLKEFISFISTLKVKHVFTSKEVLYNKTISNEIKLALLEVGITLCPIHSDNKSKGILIKTSTASVEIDSRIQKVVNLTNARPILITNT